MDNMMSKNSFYYYISSILVDICYRDRNRNFHIVLNNCEKNVIVGSLL